MPRFAASVQSCALAAPLSAAAQARDVQVGTQLSLRSARWWPKVGRTAAQNCVNVTGLPGPDQPDLVTLTGSSGAVVAADAAPRGRPSCCDSIAAAAKAAFAVEAARRAAAGRNQGSRPPGRCSRWRCAVSFGQSISDWRRPGDQPWR